MYASTLLDSLVNAKLIVLLSGEKKKIYRHHNGIHGICPCFVAKIQSKIIIFNEFGALEELKASLTIAPYQLASNQNCSRSYE